MNKYPTRFFKPIIKEKNTKYSLQLIRTARIKEIIKQASLTYIPEINTKI